jgi:serine/threonine protein kinase
MLFSVVNATVAAHDLGILHRDITPMNIVTESSRAYLADWGLAKLPASNVTASQPPELRFVFNPAFAPPEAFSFGLGCATPAWDVYMLGKVIEFVAKLCPDMPISFARLAERMTVNEPRDRPPLAVVAMEFMGADMRQVVCALCVPANFPD